MYRLLRRSINILKQYYFVGGMRKAVQSLKNRVEFSGDSMDSSLLIGICENKIRQS